jgi:hypothetical protein
MPRILPSSLQRSIASPIATKKGGGGGSSLILIGWFLLGLLTSDRILQYMDRQEAKATVAKLQKEEEEERRLFFESHKDLPTLHVTRVKFEYKMSGTRGLKGVSLNEHLEVVDEGVGPNGTYATCRRRNDAGEIVSIGWYPLSFMEKIESKTARPKKFLGLF